MSQELIRLVEARAKKENVSKFEIGDVVNVHCKILEGDKERIQIFNGVVIARSGSGVRETFTVRRIVAGQGVERKFPVHSPRIAKIEVVRSSIVRRAKLYYLRNRVGKATRLAQRRVERAETEQNVVKTMKRGKKAAQARRAAEALLARLEHKDHLAPQLVAVGGEQLRGADPYGGVGVVAAGVHAVFMHRAEALGRRHMGGRC